MIETHAHIYDEQFEKDLDLMLQRAVDKGITEIWMPNCDSSTLPKMLQVEQNNFFCKSMIGLHPSYVNDSVKNELAIIENWLEKRPFFMIGEIGLDFYWDLKFIDNQEFAFIEQLKLAKKYNLPICIHSRNSKDNSLNAINRCCELIEEFGWKNLKGIFHCFSGNLEEANRVISLNFLLGIGGVSTFKNGGLDKVLPYVSMDSIVLETDSPYLAPVPFRGKRNEVSYLDLISERAAMLMGSSKEEVIKKTTTNAQSLKNNT